jgi:Domain of unknown function (DUF932)
MNTEAVLSHHTGAELIGRQELRSLTTPEPTATHVPISHSRVVEVLAKGLANRHLNIVKDEYAVTADGMRMFGALTLDVEKSGVRVALGLRNSHDKSFSLALTVGFRVFVCDNLAFMGDFQAVIRKKHTKNFDIEETVAVALERMQNGFEPIGNRIDVWKGFELSDGDAKGIIYDAFIGDQLEAPKHLAKEVHRFYFDPQYEEFKPRTLWSIQNAFTSSFKELDPIPRMRATAKLGEFFNQFGH